MMHKLIRSIFLVFAYIPYLSWKLSSCFMNKEEAFQGASQFCALFPGKFGILLRAGFYSLSLENTSQETSIAFLTTFSNTRARISENVSIGAQCNIGASHIAKNCILSSHICITSGKNQHSYEDLDTPIRLQKSEYSTVTIGDNCWVGIGAIIMADIGEGSIIAAGSVVTNPIPAFSIAGGIPAKVIRSRLSEKDEKFSDAIIETDDIEANNKEKTQ